jgi:Icc-related predicted phosphoesterase
LVRIKIVATADLHGRLPDTPECDVLVLAGDLCPVEYDNDEAACMKWLNTTFANWLESRKASRILAIGGNHDFLFEQYDGILRRLGLPWTYLKDEGTMVDGVFFWGTPWVPNLRGWAFYGDRNQLELAYYAIPDEVDIVISHGPPAGHLDNKERRFGASQVNDMLKRVKPSVFICGHIHEGYGIERSYRKTTDLYNVAHCNLAYEGVNPPVVIHV